MAHKRSSKATSKYQAEHRREKNKIRKLETYLRKNPNDAQTKKVLTELQTKF